MVTRETDGRRLRSAATRRRIADAVLALLEEGELEPTADQVAERSGMARRTLFHHYKDFGDLYLEVGRLSLERFRPLWAPLSDEGSLDDRVARIVRARARLYEAVAPIRRAARMRAHANPEVDRALRTGYRLHRRQLEAILAPELAGAPRDTVEALDALLSWDYWERLRVAQRIGRARAESIVADGVRALLPK